MNNNDHQQSELVINQTIQSNNQFKIRQQFEAFKKKSQTTKQKTMAGFCVDKLQGVTHKMNTL